MWERRLTELSLRGVAHLDQRVLLLVEEDLDSLDVPVDACRDNKPHAEALLRGADGPPANDSHQTR